MLFLPAAQSEVEQLRREAAQVRSEIDLARRSLSEVRRGAESAGEQLEVLMDLS